VGVSVVMSRVDLRAVVSAAGWLLQSRLRDHALQLAAAPMPKRATGLADDAYRPQAQPPGEPAQRGTAAAHRVGAFAAFGG